MTYQTIGEGNTLKFQSMYSLVAVIDCSLMLCRSANWTNCAVNKSKTIVQGRTLGRARYSVTIQLQQGLRENLVIPLSDSVAVYIIYIVEHLVANHA